MHNDITPLGLACVLPSGCLWAYNAAELPGARGGSAISEASRTEIRSSVRHELSMTPLREPLVSMTMTRSAGALRLRLTSSARCRIESLKATDLGYPNGRVERGAPEVESSREEACYGAQPLAAPQVDVGLQVGPRLHVLGATSAAGELDVSLSALDALFRGRPIEPSQLAQVLVYGVKAAELPLGELLNRQRQIDTRLAAADATLAQRDATRETLATRLAELLDLQLQGVVDARVAERAQQLYGRLASSDKRSVPDPESDWWREAPGRWLTRGKALIDSLQPSDPDQAVPEQVQRDLDAISVNPSTFSWAIQALPTVCLISVTSGEAVVGQLVFTGATGVALSVVMAVLGDPLSQWLANRCCEMAAGSVSNAQSTVCHTDSHEL